MSEPRTTPADRIEARVNEQMAQHEDIYMRGASDLDRNRLWRLRDTIVRVVREELANASR